MAQETGAHIADLNPLWPAEADDVSGGADQIRKLKVALQNDFPNIDAEVSCSPTELNRSYNVTAGTVAASKVVTADSSKDINFASGNATNFKHVTGSIGTAVTAVTQSAGTGATSPTLVATVAYADNASGAVNVQLKSVSSNVTHTQSDTSFEDVTGLTFSNVAEGRYAFEAFLDCEIPATPDIKITFDVTAITGSFFGTATAYDFGTEDSDARLIPGAAEFTGLSDSSACISIKGFFYTSDPTNEITMQFAQKTADASDLIIKKGSWMNITLTNA